MVSDVRATSLSEAFVVAGEELGFIGLDVNADNQEGHSYACLKFDLSAAFFAVV